MSETIVQLTAADFEETMDFLNLVFGAHSPHDMARLIPAIYRPTDHHMAHNYAIRQQGRLRAVVGLFPIEYRLGDVLLRVGGIGGVSTHPNRRKSGLMQTLMRHCIQVMHQQGYHLSWLGGQRQRYGYFGYERCGYTCAFNANPSNIRHHFGDEPGIHFEAINPEDEERIATAVALHQAQAIHCVRLPDDFYFHCTNWKRAPFAALDQSGRMVGYLVASHAANEISELGAANGETAVRLVRAWVAQHDNQATITTSPLATDLVHRLGQFCEQVSPRTTGNWQVFDWVAAVDALIKLKRQIGPLADGSFVIDIAGCGAIHLQVDGAQARCTATDDAPDLSLSCDAAMRLLFGPLPPALVLPLPSAAAPLESWCPLPLHWPPQDNV